MAASPLTVIKIGGALLSDAVDLAPFWSAVAALQQERRVVVVHGGGPQMSELARQLGHTPRMVQGRRVTTDVDLEIVLWSLRGALNARLVARARTAGIPAVGVSGLDGGLVQVHRRPPWTVDGEQVDFGWVGDVDRVDPRLVTHLLEGGYLPVVAPLGVDDAGLLYNVNADTVACALARAAGADEFLLVTESGGVRRDARDPSSRLERCSTELFAEGTQAGWIEGGMRVKLQVAFDALSAGVSEVHILAPNDLLARTSGTHIVP